MQSFSKPPHPSMSLCVWVCTVWMCVCTLVSASFTLSQPLSHVSMNHNMQLNINHCISCGASYADAPSQITSNGKHAKTRKEKKKSPLNSDTEWFLFLLIKLVYLITCSSDEWSPSLESDADGGNIKPPRGSYSLWANVLHTFDLQKLYSLHSSKHWFGDQRMSRR